MRWIILGMTIACNIGAQTLLKAAMNRLESSSQEPPRLWDNQLLVLGILLSGATLILYMFTLKKFELSVAYPLVTSLALLGVFVCSAFLFNEQMHWMKLLGGALIIGGVVMLCLPSGNITGVGKI